MKIILKESEIFFDSLNYPHKIRKWLELPEYIMRIAILIKKIQKIFSCGKYLICSSKIKIDQEVVETESTWISSIMVDTFLFVQNYVHYANKSSINTNFKVIAP